jgi:GNAT superfamily N-acetyltransferase
MMFVDGGYHRRGIATAMMNNMAYALQSQGINRITLNASPYGIPFYEKYGFKSTDTVQHKDGFVFTPMEYRITNHNITIRRTNPGDEVIVESVLLSTVQWLNTMEQPLWAENDVKWERLSKGNDITECYIAEQGGKPCGCMILKEVDHFFWPDVPESEALFLHKLAVTNAARKQGVGDALIEFAIEESVRRGRQSLRLDCHAKREKLRKFYERHGFECVGEKVYNNVYDVPTYFTAFYIRRITNAISSN